MHQPRQAVLVVIKLRSAARLTNYSLWCLSVPKDVSCGQHQSRGVLKYAGQPMGTKKPKQGNDASQV